MLSKDWQIQGMGSGLGFTAGLSYDYVDQNQLRSGSGKISNIALPNAQEVEHRTRTTFTTLIADYQGSGWGVNMQLPYIERYHTTYPQGTVALDSSRSSSLGDMKILARYAGLSKDGTNGIFLGIKLPTGPTNVNFRSGATLDASLQPSTGSTDVLFGGFHQGQIDKLKMGWFLQGLIQHAISTRNEYRPGDTFTINAGIRYAKFGGKVAPMLQVNYIRRISDSGANASPSITGGNLAYLSPGVSIRLGNGTNAYAFIQIPVYQYVQGIQLNPTKIISIGILHAI